MLNINKFRLKNTYFAFKQPLHKNFPKISSCCAFFRRSLNKKYTCRRENQCKIDQDGMRNACRACRLNRCYKAGMSVDSEKNQSPAGEQKSRLSYSVSNNEYFTSTPPLPNIIYSSPSDQTSSSGIVNFQEPDPARFPFIHKVLNDFLTLQRSQKSLYSIENPHTIFADTEFVQITKTLFKRMENGTMSLIHNLLSETLDYYGHLDNKLKIEVAKQVSHKYASLHRCFLTAKHFPNPNDKRISTHYGYYVDPDNFNDFFDNQNSPYTPEQKAKIIRPVLELSWKTSNKFRALKIRELEVAALASIFIWNKLEDMNLMTEEMALKRDATHREFYTNIISNYGVETGSTRVVRILSLIEDILTLNASYSEMIMIASIFTPEQNDSACSMSQCLTQP